MYGQNSFFCMVDGDTIYQVSQYDKMEIGKTSAFVNTLQETLDEYYDKLVELGVIEIPKTQEEINAEMQQALKESQNLNLQLMQLLKDMQGGNNNEQGHPEQSETDVSGSQPGQRGKSSRGNNKGNTTQPDTIEA